MIVVYPVIFTRTKDEKDSYLIYIPDIAGMTEGYGLPDAIAMAKDYIGNALYAKKDADMPAASCISSIDAGMSPFFDAGESFVSLVDTDIDSFRRIKKSRTVRRNITLPAWLDEMAGEAHINVSLVSQLALKRALGIAPEDMES